MSRLTHPGSRGQATVEHLGLALAVALALAALGVWLAPRMHPPTQPPRVLEAVVAPLEAAPAPGRDLAAYAWAMRAQHLPARSGPSGLRRLAGRVVDWGLLNAEGELEAARGFGGRLRERLGSFAADPTDAVRDLVRSAEDPRGLLKGRWRDLVRYAGDLTKLPARDAFRRVSRDAGRLAADLAVARVARAGRRAITRRVTGSPRASRSPRTPPGGVAVDPRTQASPQR